MKTEIVKKNEAILKQLLIILMVIISTNCFSQITFEKGYFINNDEEKIECLIRNLDWKNNPNEFEYKLLENTEKQKAIIKNVKEFGIYNYSKYVRSTVNIDRSSNILNFLSDEKSPIFKEEELFLKVLVIGKSNLYRYDQGNLIRFFYSIDDSNNIEQLVFKIYNSTKNVIGENNRFRQQLLINLKCEDITINDVKNLSYENNELVKLFVRYNKCVNSDLINFNAKQKKDLFNLSPKMGLKRSSYYLQNLFRSSRDADFGYQLGFTLGLEVELIFPFNRNKWSVLIEPTYQYFKSEKEFTTFTAKIDYKSIELPIGIRHSFHLNKNSKLFINCFYIFDFTSNSTLLFSTGRSFRINDSLNFGFGLGYKHNNRYSLEFRYNTNRNFIGSSSDNSYYKSMYVIFGYTIF